MLRRDLRIVPAGMMAKAESDLGEIITEPLASGSVRMIRQGDAALASPRASVISCPWLGMVRSGWQAVKVKSVLATRRPLGLNT